jgi:hypothetical protein
MIKQEYYILKVIFNVFLLVFLHNRMTQVKLRFVCSPVLRYDFIKPNLSCFIECISENNIETKYIVQYFRQKKSGIKPLFQIKDLFFILLPPIL